jgi:outer membrane protein OmpA-like peptidoglycan-associated protein
MSAAAMLSGLARESSKGAGDDAGFDRQALAGILAQIARNLEPALRTQPNEVHSIDPRLEQLRTLLLGREIELLSRLREAVEDPEQLAAAIGRVLPTAIALTSTDGRLGQVLAPALEKATQSSIRSDPRTLVNVLYPLIVPAIRKSIGETIDATFQSLNESLKYSLTWRGLRWRWEAWRTGTSFAEVVLKHTLVYQVEHVFLIHRHTGLLIAHVAGENAVGQDPQLVSSMLVAIQDFVQDSFGGAEQALDAVRLGELKLWSEPGPFATLVALIRGNPPEELHETLRGTLSRIHAERRQALESFDGDSSGFADVEAHLREVATLRQAAPRHARTGFPWLVALIGLMLLVLASAGGWRWWQIERSRAAETQLWADAVAQLRAQPGIVVVEAGRRGDGFVIAGLRDPLAVDPEVTLRQAGIDPARVASRWQPYQGLDPEFVMKRLEASLDPPPGITLAVVGDRIVAQGEASDDWLEQARIAGRMLPAGGPILDLSKVRDANEATLAKRREAFAALAGLRRTIQSRQIHFPLNEPLPAPGQDALLDQLAGDLKELASVSAAAGVTPRVALIGHSDDTGKGTFNLSLSVARANAVVALLKKRGVDPDLLTVRGAGTFEPIETGASEDARSANRRVSVTVGIEGQP